MINTETDKPLTTPTPCVTPTCHPNASIIISRSRWSRSAGSGCGNCECNHGFAGTGLLCGPDNDSDGWSDVSLNCTEEVCGQDNCVGVPNSGQEDSDEDGEGDACDNDADNDGVAIFWKNDTFKVASIDFLLFDGGKRNQGAVRGAELGLDLGGRAGVPLALVGRLVLQRLLHQRLGGRRHAAQSVVVDHCTPRSVGGGGVSGG